MRASEIVGGLSVIGVIALIGFAIAEDNDPETITTPTAPTILAPVDAPTTTLVEPTPTEPSSEAEGFAAIFRNNGSIGGRRR